MNDRRRTGANRTVLTNNNGERVEVYNVSAGKLQTWVTLFLGLAAVVAIVFGAARFGVQIEVTDAIKAEAQDEGGLIHTEIHGCVEELIEEVQGVFQDDLDVFETEQKTMGEAVIRLEVRQIAVIKTVDDQHEEVMTELRALRDHE